MVFVPPPWCPLVTESDLNWPTRHWSEAVSMLVQRLRCWTNIQTGLAQYIAFVDRTRARKGRWNTLLARVCSWTLVWTKEFSFGNCVACCYWKGCIYMHDPMSGPNNSQPTQDVEFMLVWRWSSVVDGGPPLKQHWFYVLCLPGYNIKPMLF